ncbi:prolipoprotein diacylglyceryl transferase [Desulfonatronovibrio hydrogenovorans]|uniref:prolipoprotein diacylglyceryl transferase n=1 Tax=Desulfonatronovibrio hydrogenovorans TaxID=53245 RepID=UPI00049054A3|nr:prolipoprotein diacylglyceryl transferase [Desulfonatronovibrio hydrogenovorans]
MHPVLIEAGLFKLYSFGFFIAAAFLLGMAWTMREAVQKGLDQRLVLDIGFYVLLGGLAGARLLYVAFNPGVFTDDPLGIFKFWKGGLIFMGGAVSAGLLMIIFLARRKQPILPWLDAAAPGIALGLFVGWLGCFAAGCGYGKPCDLPWCAVFTHPDSLGPLFKALHPTQIYHALVALVCFILLLGVKARTRDQGRIAGLFLVLYPLAGMTVDLLRNDLSRELGIVSVNQVLALGVLVAGLILVYRKTGHYK